MTAVVELPPGLGTEAKARRRFEELFVAESDAVLGYALRRVEHPEDAGDILAETFLVAWRRIPDVPPGDEGRLWLYGVARRVLANHRRGSGRRRRLGERLSAALADELLPHVPSDRVETSLVVGDAMDRLPEEDRELLHLTSWEGLTPTELATVLAIPAATVRTRLHRARRRLAAILEESGLGGERNDSNGHVAASGHPPAGYEEEPT